MWETLPEFGTAVLYGVLVAAAYTFAVSIVAAGGRPRLLQSARLGAYGTSALVLLGVAVLSYAFMTHDFRIKYVSGYSDRGMGFWYLLAALWGGQDGSLLWWLFLLSGYNVACIRWLHGRYRQLQPYVIATLMATVGFFTVLMLFSANPFEINMVGAKVDGEGLNPLLRDIYMIIHPPSLYMGFVGCTIPFAFAVAALVTGRLDNEWIVAVRKWMLFAWIFLTVGNALGMLWAYKELGWGGYWAWDPVENAACLPWFSASAYVHSTMIQERRNMFKVWNVVLIAITFFLTIFGTFLTRSGIIASVHSFAKSDIGIYFVWFMVIIVATSVALIVWRLPMLRSRSQIESVASREAAFVMNNWALLGIAAFIAVATLFSKISLLFWNEEITVGPHFFNRWMAPMGLFLLLLMGAAPLLGWRKTSNDALWKAARMPVIVALIVTATHFALGSSIGFPAIVPDDATAGASPVDLVMRAFSAIAPALTVALVAFNFAVVFQEFQRGIKARRRNSNEGGLQALLRLVNRSRRRYGGYLVHVGVGLLFLGFVGKAWDLEKEIVVSPGETVELGGYSFTYKDTKMTVDTEKRAITAFVEVKDSSGLRGTAEPAQHIYTKGGMNTSEVALLSGLRDDVYIVVGSVNPKTKRATFRLHVNPLVMWIWIGVLLMMCGAIVSLWPEGSWRSLGVWGTVRLATGTATGIMFAILAASAPVRALESSDPVTAQPQQRLNQPDLRNAPRLQPAPSR